MNAFFTGFLLGLSLILPIGAQNSFVLKCGLKRQYVFWVCLFCASSDALLIMAGVFSINFALKYITEYVNMMYIGVSLWLAFYGILHVKSAMMGSSFANQEQQQQNHTSLWRVLSICAVFTWLNPHVYLDTTILIGTISASFDYPQRYIFMIGAIIASFCFFYSIGLAAHFLSPYINNRKSWRVIDSFIAMVMFMLAYNFVIKTSL